MGEAERNPSRGTSLGEMTHMDKDIQDQWFTSLQHTLEEAYLQHEEPWKQSGFSGPEERWTACRKPIADCIDRSGTFLDIGCANGYLIECVLRWTSKRNIRITPYGLDLSSRLIELARERVPDFKDKFYKGNGWDWESPIRFDFVRTEIVYVPEELQKRYIERIIERYLADGGSLLLAEYRSRQDPVDKPWLNDTLKGWGFSVIGQLSGFYESKELTRILVIKK